MTALLDKHPATPDPKEKKPWTWKRILGIVIYVLVMGGLVSLIVLMVASLTLSDNAKEPLKSQTVSYDRHLSDYMAELGVSNWTTVPVELHSAYNCPETIADSHSWNFLIWGKTDVKTQTTPHLCYEGRVTIGTSTYLVAIPAGAVDVNSGAETASITLGDPVVDRYSEYVQCDDGFINLSPACWINHPPKLDPARLDKFRAQGIGPIIEANATAVNAPLSALPN